jgi:hypothetical protein
MISASCVARITGMSHWCMAFFLRYQGLNSVLVFTKQMLYCLSHASSPFCSGYFGNRVSLGAQAGLNLDLSTLSFLPQLEWRACTIMPSFFPLRWCLRNFFSLAWVGLEPPSFQSQIPA